MTMQGVSFELVVLREGPKQALRPLVVRRKVSPAPEKPVHDVPGIIFFAMHAIFVLTPVFCHNDGFVVAQEVLTNFRCELCPHGVKTFVVS